PPRTWWAAPPRGATDPAGWTTAGHGRRLGLTPRPQRADPVDTTQETPMSQDFPRTASDLDAVDDLVDPDQEFSGDGTLSYDDEPDGPAEEVDAQQEYGEVTAEDLGTDDLVQDGSEVVEDAGREADGALAGIDPAQPATDRLAREQDTNGIEDEGEGAMSDPAVDHVVDADDA
ncbi:hypothetical protein, partial [Kytococcus sp. HMSC28H12]